MKDTVHITFDLGTVGSLKQYLGTNTDIIYLDALLGFGDISNIENIKSRKDDYLMLYKQMFFKPLSTPPNNKALYKFKNRINKVKGSSKSFMIYASKTYIHEYCGLLYICDLLKNETLYLFDYPDKYTRPDWYLSDLIHPEKKQVKLGYSLITEEEKEEYINKWNQLKEANTELRILENGNIIGHQYSDYYDYIKSFYPNNKELDYMQVIGKILDEKVALDYNQLVVISNKMIDEGELEIIREEPKKWYDQAKNVFVRPRRK